MNVASPESFAADKSMKILVTIFLSMVFLGLRAEAVTYTVKAGGGGNFSTISACSAAAVAGDTCTVFAGTYAGWTQTSSGTAGSPITFIANTGDTVTVTSSITLSGHSYITVSGLTLRATMQFDSSSTHNIVTHCTATTTLANLPDSTGSTGSDNLFSFNLVDRTGISGNAQGWYFYGDRNRFENNEIKNGSGDCFDIGGANVIVRNNYCHDVNGGSGEHIDFVQIIGGGTSPTLSFSLIENNINQNCTADGGNCHGLAIIRTGSGPVADTNILRYNYAQNIDGDCINFGGVGDDVPNNSAYNNTCASGHLASYNESFDSTQGNTPNTTILNNIAYNVEAGGQYAFGANFENGNLVFTTGYSGSWSSPYSGEATYAALHNQDPKFANYPTDDSLQAGSPAIGAGVALTTASGAGSSSTSLTLANAHVFQPGWAGVNGDCIRIGASTTTCITAINYSTQVATISPAATWNNGDPVYLYKKSDGTVVLNGAKPDIGAFVSTQTQAGGPAPPANLQATVN